MTIKEQKAAAKQFAAEWKDRGYEKGEYQSFWLELLRTVFGISNPERFIQFEKPVLLERICYIDAFIPSSVLIEQKSKDVDLNKAQKQSDGSELTPYKQAKRYANELEHSKKPRWIVVSNFQEFQVHDMEHPHDPPETILLKDLPKEYHRLAFLTDSTKDNIKRETELSLQAGEIVGKLYDEILKHYQDPKAESTLKSLNILCVRLVFCLYAEDAGIFAYKNHFHDYLAKFEPHELRGALKDLFKILNTKVEDRNDPYLDKILLDFPYVNGGLFAEENVEIPQLGENVKQLLLAKASEGFNWSEISPTIFGAVFESTLNPETRRSGGMHYTSIENIHKVIDPLFLDELKNELDSIIALKDAHERDKRLIAFQEKLASLTFLDPACGSGNFLTETYLSLRKLENRILECRNMGHINLTYHNPIRVSIGQFYGIEINDFAVSVAKTALWISECQMMKETEDIVHMDLDFLPLKSYANIVEGNALRIDWNAVVSKNKLNYIMGNPPFCGYSNQSPEQKEDMLSIYVDDSGRPYPTAGKIDYVAGWYFKASAFMQRTKIRTAFVSTNSITQGEQVAGVWKPLIDRFGIHIDFACRTFRWDSEANIKAHVHCVIIGFSKAANPAQRRIFEGETCLSYESRDNINPYLTKAPNIFIESRKKTLCPVPEMITGNRPADGGHLIIEADDYAAFIQKEPGAVKFIKKLVGSEEFINGKKRYCLWLVGASPAELRSLPEVMKRIESCRQDRLNSPDEGRRKLADTPMLFRETYNPENFIIVPCVSSEQRPYVPMGFLDEDTISTNLNLIIPSATLFHFGVLESSVHMAWMRTVCGRLEMRYRYSKDIVYNNFPWPDCTSKQSEKAAELRQEISETAQGILDARAMYPDCSLADLYDETTMPPELRKAHQANDRAVMKAYGFEPGLTEPEIVAKLMGSYQKLVKKANTPAAAKKRR